MTPAELKPCPFCGVEDGDHDDGAPFLGLDEDDNGTPFVKCSNCGARAGRRDTEAKAIVAWNERADHLESEPSGGLREKISQEMEWAARQLSVYLRHLRSKNDPMALAFTNALAEFNDTRKFLATPKPPESAEPGSDGVTKELWDFVTKVALGASISSCRAHARKLMEVNILTRPAEGKE